MGETPVREREREVVDTGNLQVRTCPFCGGEPYVDRTLRDGYAEWRDDPDAWAYAVNCTGCACVGPWQKSATGAVKYWNGLPGVTRVKAKVSRTALALAALALAARERGEG